MTTAAAEVAATAEALTTPGAAAQAPSWPTRVARRAARLAGPQRVLVLGLLAAVVITVGLIAGPFATPSPAPVPVGPDAGDGTPAGPAGAVTARPWPSWASSVDDSSSVPLTPVSSSPYLLSTGYRGWAATPPSAVLASGPQGGEPNPLGEEARGIYLTSYTANQTASFRHLLELVDSTALNAMVINIKDEEGRATYDTKVQAFRDAGAVSIQIDDIEGLLRMTEAYGIYTIGRLVTFEDSCLPVYNPDLAVHRPDGSLWRDQNGQGWVDAFQTEAWDYNLALAEEAASLGFDEIQFDYVRFPTDGDTRNMVLSRPSGDNNINRVRAISEFLNYARERLSPYGVAVSADVFGITCSTRGDTALGQVLEDVAASVDYISPMIYPSHYGPGHFGLDNPNAEPYLTVHGALQDALDRLGLEGQVKLRPWLQDFSLGYPYGPAEVLDQIRATNELGIKGFLLWSPSNIYTESALRAYTANLDAYLNPEGG